MLTELEKRILSTLENAILQRAETHASGPGAAVHIDELAHLLSMNISDLSAALTILEVRRQVERAPGMLYSLPSAASHASATRRAGKN